MQGIHVFSKPEGGEFKEVTDTNTPAEQIPNEEPKIEKTKQAPPRQAPAPKKEKKNLCYVLLRDEFKQEIQELIKNDSLHYPSITSFVNIATQERLEAIKEARFAPHTTTDDPRTHPYKKVNRS